MQLVALAGDDPSRGWLQWSGRVAPCSFGRGGLVAADAKREGDGATPIGVWALRRVLFRADRLESLATKLPARPLLSDDGWCDDPADAAYNRPVRLPYPARHEVMTRDDGLYDVVVVLGHNDDPPSSGMGSAIFLHCAKRADGTLATPDDPGAALNVTQGCVAVARATLAALLADVGPGATLTIGDPPAAMG